MKMQDTQARLRSNMAALCPGAPPTPRVKLQLLDYQLKALYVLARQFNRKGARILEIGTGQGGSGYMLSHAAPLAEIRSLTTTPAEAVAAERFWASQGRRNVMAQVVSSWELLKQSHAAEWDMVFIDGDHNRIARDLPWFDRLRPGGLLLCHDYSPADSRSPSAIAFAELNAMAEKLGRPFDVLLVDEFKIGMAGFYRQGDERLTEYADVPLVGAPVIMPEHFGTVPWSQTPTGVVMRSGLMATDAAHAGFAVTKSDEWALCWPRTLFAAHGVTVPWDLVPSGFRLLEKWDVAVPFTPKHTLATELGTQEEREAASVVMHDLRVPAYSPDLLFVRDSEAGVACLKAWRTEAESCSDERLAFLVALHQVKPKLCVLPRMWFASQAERDAMDRLYKRPARTPKPAPKPKPVPAAKAAPVIPQPRPVRQSRRGRHR